LSIGIVQGIAAPAGLNILIEGEGGHAGTVLMPERKDAFLAGAELALEIEGLTRKLGGADTVATVGKCDVFPGAVNSIPSRLKMSLDLRDTDGSRRDRVLEAIGVAAKEIAARRKTKISLELLNADAPASCDAQIIEAVRAACDANGVRYREMVSRAYHDSLFMHQVCPMGMIFIPCRGGVSHRPDEYSSPGQIATGVLVLAETLARLAGGER